MNMSLSTFGLGGEVDESPCLINHDDIPAFTKLQYLDTAVVPKVVKLVGASSVGDKQVAPTRKAGKRPWD